MPKPLSSTTANWVQSSVPSIGLRIRVTVALCVPSPKSDLVEGETLTDGLVSCSRHTVVVCDIVSDTVHLCMLWDAYVSETTHAWRQLCGLFSRAWMECRCCVSHPPFKTCSNS